MAERELFYQKTSWHGRDARLLGNDKVRLVVLTGGGHVAEFRFAESTGLSTVSALWVPVWKLIEPYHYRAKVHAARYGPPAVGRLLAGIAGNNLCLDHFGVPSDEEAAQGLPLHGEAGVSRWRKKRLVLTPRRLSLTLEVKLPIAGLQFQREIELRRGESVVYYKETVTNERQADHFFDWQQHATFGPPFLSRQDSRLALSGTRGLVYSGGYEGRDLLQPGAEFRWPNAPGVGGGKVDLRRPLARRGRGILATVLLDQRREVQYVAAYNLRYGVLLGYTFRWQDFPWSAIWEENHARLYPPWNGKSETRGMEFGSTPLPVTPREAAALGPLFGAPSCAVVPARGKKVIRYASFLAALPKGFKEVKDIRVRKGAIEVRAAGNKEPVVVAAAGVARNNAIFPGA
jgi:hypothetical protein